MEEQKQKTKYRNQSIFIWIVVIIITIFLAQNIFMEASAVFGEKIYTFAALTIIIGYFIATIFYELGKVIIGKIAGFRLVLLNFFGLTFTRDNKNKLKLGFGKFVNYGGKTIMSPKNEKSKLILYLLGGTIFTILLNIGILVGSVLISKKLDIPELPHIAYLFSTVSLIVLIFNDAPFINDDIYDGFILRLLFTNKNFKSSYNKMLLEEDAIITGRGELLYFENIDYSNPLYVKASLYNYYYFMNKGQEAEAEKMVLQGLEHEDYLSTEDLGLLNSQKYYFSLLKGNEEIVGEEFYKLEKSVRKVAVSYHHYETLKTALLVAAIVDSSYDLYEYILSKIDKLKDKTSPLILDKETELIDKSLDCIQKKKSDWFREDNEDSLS